MDEEHPSIQLVREMITITLHDHDYNVLVSSVFYNSGETTTIQVGFPSIYSVNRGKSHIDFETEVDGRKVQFQSPPDLFATTDYGNHFYRFLRWYVKEVQFPKEDYTTTTNKYSAAYDWEERIGSEGRVAEYLFGTGRTWKGEIKEIEVVVRNEAEWWITGISVRLGNKNYYNSEIADRYFLNAVDRNTFRIWMFNIEPLALQDSITISFSGSDVPHPFDPTDPSTSETEQYYFDKKPISSFYLNVLTKKQLRIVRNVIYAWHGYSFRSPDLQSFFATRDWYKVNPDFSESDLNQQERENRDTILEEEILRGAKELGL
jgi:hypothetical protein